MTNSHSIGKGYHFGKHASGGFSLMEVVIAIAVVAVSFIGIIGLLGLGVASDRTSTQQTVGSNIASSILADLRSTPAYTATGKSTRYNITLPTTATTTPLTPLQGVAASYIYFDNSSNALNSTPLTTTTALPAGAAYLATVYLSEIGSVGSGSTAQTTDLARVVVSWPAMATPPVGNFEVVSEFILY